jgi:hypothetical protein
MELKRYNNSRRRILDRNIHQHWLGPQAEQNGTERNGPLEEAISIYNRKTLGEEHRSVATSNMDLVGARQEARIIP